MEMAEPTHSIPAELRLQQCPRCGYRLDGLPPVGKCPECGRPYDEQTIYLFGWSAGTRAKADTGTRSTLIALLLLMIFPLLNLLSMVRTHGVTFFAAVAVVLYGITISGIFWKRSSRPPGLPGAVRIAFRSSGCAQSDTAPADLDWTAWDQVGDVTIGPIRGVRWRVRVGRVNDAWWKVQWRPKPVDAIVECTPEQGNALRDYILSRRQGRWANEVIRRP